MYLKSSKLVKYVTEFSKTSLKDPRTFLELTESFWISMYERGYIEIDDVRFFQEWLSALANIGYNFPKCPVQNSGTELAQVVRF